MDSYGYSWGSFGSGVKDTWLEDRKKPPQLCVEQSDLVVKALLRQQLYISCKKLTVITARSLKRTDLKV